MTRDPGFTCTSDHPLPVTQHSGIALHRGEAADLDAPQALENHAYEGVRA
ncbi:hypothetical protein ABZ649_17460 [Streptomyces albidoflavus]|uniref:Uncharacterized protein n=1 Tax=Streptomyces albidoflavus TaxID=1886 RepID=A0AA37C4J0_9ACTN|nr:MULTISPECIES: hypothetical protein [Streptomyces]MYX49080.1 hypothetical protein [Streptomyces sp. SID8385]MYX84093.1 hypothetical protein [Streptomyces sp. SID4915]QLA55066.1 hypothetical protein HWN34_26585 [Streptomyces violascens]AMM11975.1 hypothetical protein Salbus254_5534 [Streptomyces albidoflavus]MBK3382918.1 hypothetical protein [Streptomyces sp. DEF147AK]